MRTRLLVLAPMVLAPLLLAACGSGHTPTSAENLVAARQRVQPFEGVLSHTGQPRSLDALTGHPTVVWFFPMAGTPG